MNRPNTTLPRVEAQIGDEIRRPLEIALDAALLVMRNGGSTVAAERSFSNILKGLGEQAVATVWRLDFVAASNADRSIVRSVGPIGVNLTRASEVALLGEGVAQGTIPLSALEAEVERIRNLPTPYNRWMTVAVAAGSGACFSQVAGGDWGSLAIAGLAAGAGQLLRGPLQAKRLATAPVTLICGLVSALVAAAGLRFGFSEVESATLIASVTYIVPGLPLINGFIDMVTHRHLVVGFERMLNAAFLFLVLALAIALARTIVGLQAPTGGNQVVPSAIFMNALWAALSATGLGVMLTAPVRYLVAAFACGFLGRGLRDVCTGLGLNGNWATVIAAAAVVLAAVAITRRQRVSPVVLICGVLPLGSAVAVFNLIFAMVQISSATGDKLASASIALTASAGKVFTTSLAIAIGLAVGMAIERLVKRQAVAAA